MDKLKSYIIHNISQSVARRQSFKALVIVRIRLGSNDPEMTSHRSRAAQLCADLYANMQAPPKEAAIQAEPGMQASKQTIINGSMTDRVYAFHIVQEVKIKISREVRRGSPMAICLSARLLRHNVDIAALLLSPGGRAFAGLRCSEQVIYRAGIAQ